MKTTWQDISIKPYRSFSGKQSSDVVIIGGGITGISTAYLLAKEGRSVIVVEKEELLETTTAYTTAFLTSNIDTELRDLKKMYGMRKVRKIIDSHEQAIDTIEKIINEEKIECEFKRVNNYMVVFKKRTLKLLKKNTKIRDILGYESSIVEPGMFSFPNHGAWEIKKQAKFHPLKYLAALRKKAEDLGVQFFDHSEALDIKGKENITIKMGTGSIDTKDVVIATYNPFKQPWWYIFKKGMYLSYVMEIEVANGTLEECLIEDDSNPYHYVRIDRASEKLDRIIVGGADHRKELPIDEKRGFNAIKDFIEKKLKISEYKIISKWSGNILESSDGLALIGRQSRRFKNRYVATAFSGNGMTYGTISAILIRDMIMGEKNPWENIYDPGRMLSFKALLVKGKDYMGEFIHGVRENLSHSKKRVQTS
jgi:glycine/D-amino acid oxidase-like deaminating enzyme